MSKLDIFIYVLGNAEPHRSRMCHVAVYMIVFTLKTPCVKARLQFLTYRNRLSSLDVSNVGIYLTHIAVTRPMHIVQVGLTTFALYLTVNVIQHHIYIFF